MRANATLKGCEKNEALMILNLSRGSLITTANLYYLLLGQYVT